MYQQLLRSVIDVIQKRYILGGKWRIVEHIGQLKFADKNFDENAHC